MIIAAGCGVDDHQQDAPTGSALFDPCQDIKDSVFKKAGFDPATKKHPVPEFPERCSVESPSGNGLVLEHYLSMGVPEFDRALARQQSTLGDKIKKVTVNGRDAFTEPQTLTMFGSSSPLGCAVNLRTKLGMLRIGSSLTRNGADGCTEALAAATVLEPSLGPNR
ncbi:hypothetical protein NS14008_27970 [Nocardia seriolae]|nr:hypothetical protein NS14008_27970 [Nocardia seriolae]